MTHPYRLVLKYVVFDLLRSRIIALHGVFFLATSWGLLYFSEDASLAVASLLNLVLLVIPLVGLLFGGVYFYNSREFLELLLAQPMNRAAIYLGHYLGLAVPLAAVFAIATAGPFLGYAAFGKTKLDEALPFLLAAGVLLTLTSTGIAYWVASLFDDRVKALGLLLAIWVGLVFLYDGLILFISVFLRDYPLERPVLALVLLNPVDLARISVFLRLDAAALMGYTGAVFEKFLGGATGTGLALAALLIWTVLPFALGRRFFIRKDF